MRKSIPLILSLLFFISLASTVQAPLDVDITNIPQAVGDAFGVSAWIGGLFMSAIIFLALVMPTLLLRNKAPSMILSVMVIAFCVSAGWLDTWIVLIIVLLTSVLWASKIKRVFT